MNRPSGKSGLSVEARQKINPYTKIIQTSRCVTALDEIIESYLFGLDRVLGRQFHRDSDHDHEHDSDIKFVFKS
ncbi:MAG: hypothetical protein CM15mP117_22710 [Alphaproteobacteria bacterium]|nr:MAG: hypothetical protein CM15mP117_22710 [Alphaproteobacteria bacterium]